AGELTFILPNALTERRDRSSSDEPAYRLGRISAATDPNDPIAFGDAQAIGPAELNRQGVFASSPNRDFRLTGVGRDSFELEVALWHRDRHPVGPPRRPLEL